MRSAGCGRKKGPEARPSADRCTHRLRLRNYNRRVTMGPQRRRPRLIVAATRACVHVPSECLRMHPMHARRGTARHGTESPPFVARPSTRKQTSTQVPGVSTMIRSMHVSACAANNRRNNNNNLRNSSYSSSAPYSDGMWLLRARRVAACEGARLDLVHDLHDLRLRGQTGGHGAGNGRGGEHASLW